MNSRNFTGLGTAELFVTSPWGVGILALQGGAFQSPFMAATGAVFGGWRSDSSENHFGPTGLFNGGSTAAIMVTSGWGIGFVQYENAQLTSIGMAGNGTVLQGPEVGGDNYNFVAFPIDSNSMRFGPVGRFDGGNQSVIGINANAIATLGVANGNVVANAVIPFNTAQSGGWQPSADDWFGAVADYDGDGTDEVLVVGAWGIAFVRLSHAAPATLALATAGQTLGGWTFDPTVDQFGPVGDFDGDGKPECFVRNAAGFALLKFVNGALTTIGAVTFGGWIGGWRTGSGDRHGPAADFNGDRRAELLISSGWGMAILAWNGSAWSAYGVIGNGTACGNWRIDTLRDRLELADDFDGDGRAELFVSSGWGIGLLDLSGTPASKLAVANGALLGGWRIDTIHNNLDCGIMAHAMILVNNDWGDAVSGAAQALRNRGTTVQQIGDATAFVNALVGCAAVAQPGDRLFVYIASHGDSKSRVGPDTSAGPAGMHGLQPNSGFLHLSDISPRFKAMGTRGCDLIVFDGSCEGGETVVDAAGQSYCAVSTTGAQGSGLTGIPNPGLGIADMPVPSVFGTWWTSPDLIASRINGQILTASNSLSTGVTRINQRLFRNDGTAASNLALFGRGPLAALTTLGAWWLWQDCQWYLYPLLFPYETAQLVANKQFPSSQVFTASTQTALDIAAGYLDPWAPLFAPYQAGILDAAAADASLAQSYAQNFGLIWQCLADDPGWNPNTDSAKYAAQLGGINVAQFTGADGFTRLVDVATFYFLTAIALYYKQRDILAALDAAAQANGAIKNRLPAPQYTRPALRSGMEVVKLMRAHPLDVTAAAPQAQKLTVTLAPMPPIVGKPTQADVNNYIENQLGRLGGNAISQPTGDATIDQLTAQLLATYQDQVATMVPVSFMLSIIEDQLCSKQSAGLVIPGDRVMF
jgi:hypothetical protein